MPKDVEAHIKLMFDLQVLAWQANITRVTTLLMAKELSNAVYPKSGVRSALSSTNHNRLLVLHRTRVSHAVELWMWRVLPRLLLAVHNSASRLSGAIEPRAERQGHDGPWMRHV